MRDDHHIPVTGGHTGKEALAVAGFEVLLRRGQHVGTRIKFDEVLRPLADEMVRHREDRLAGQTHAAQFHDGRDNGEGLTGTDHVIEQRRVTLYDAPDGVRLMGTQPDNVIGHLTGERQVRAVELAGDIGVELVIVETRQLRTAGIVLPDPAVPRVPNEGHLLIGELGFGLIQRAGAVAVRVIDLHGFLRGRSGQDIAQRHAAGAITRGGAGGSLQLRENPASGERVEERAASGAFGQMVGKLPHDLGGDPRCARFDGDIHRLDILRLDGFQGIDVPG